MRFVIMVYANGAYQEFRLPALNDADYEIMLPAVRFGLNDDIVLQLEVISGAWKVLSGKEYTLFGRDGEKDEICLQDGLTLSVGSKGEQVALIVTGETEGLPCFKKFDIRICRRLPLAKIRSVIFATTSGGLSASGMLCSAGKEMPCGLQTTAQTAYMWMVSVSREADGWCSEIRWIFWA